MTILICSAANLQTNDVLHAGSTSSCFMRKSRVFFFGVSKSGVTKDQASTKCFQETWSIQHHNHGLFGYDGPTFAHRDSLSPEFMLRGWDPFIFRHKKEWGNGWLDFSHDIPIIPPFLMAKSTVRGTPSCIVPRCPFTVLLDNPDLGRLG